jgi:predicted nucleic acid-binding Zn ribbon protein
MEHRKCLECGDHLKGRIDKKFCSDYCRNSYNNKVNKDSKNLIRNMNNRLRKNHKILSELNTRGKTKIPRTQLYDKGLTFNCLPLSIRLKQETLIFIYMTKDIWL